MASKVASKSTDLNDCSTCLLNLPWTIMSRQPRLDGGDNECCRGQQYHRSPRYQPQVEQNFYNPPYNANISCPYYDNSPGLGLGPALAKQPFPRPYAMDNNRVRSSEPNNLRPCMCYAYTTAMQEAPPVAAPPPAETRHMENIEEYNRQPLTETDATENSHNYDEETEADPSQYMEYPQSKVSSGQSPPTEIESGTGIRSRDDNDPLYFDPLNCRSTGRKRKRKVTKIYVPAPSFSQRCQCPKEATTQQRNTYRDVASGCHVRCPRCRSRTRDNRPSPAVAGRTKARTRRPFAERSQQVVGSKARSAGRSCTCATSERINSKRRPTDYIELSTMKKMIKRNPLAVCRRSSQMDGILPHEGYLEKYDQNWANRQNSSARPRSIHGRNPLAMCRPCSKREEQCTEQHDQDYQDENRARKYQTYDSNETMMERQENTHRYCYPENCTGAQSSSRRSSKIPKKCRMCGICDQMGCMPTKPRGGIRLVCRLQPKRPTAGSASYGKLFILPDAQTKKSTTIYRSFGAPHSRRRVRRKTRKNSYFPAVPGPCLLRICYETPGPKTRHQRCKGGTNGSAGVLRTRTRPTTAAEAQSMMPQRHSTSVPRQTARREPSVPARSSQGRSGGASPSRLPPSQLVARRSTQQPQVQAQAQAQPQPQTRHSQQPQAQPQPQAQTRYSQQPQAQAHRAQQHRLYDSPNHLESPVLPASVNQSLPGLVRPIPVHPKSELARTFPSRIPNPAKAQRLQTPAEEKPLPSRPPNPTPYMPQNKAESPTRPQHQETVPSRPQNHGRSPTRPQHQEATQSLRQNEDRAASKPQYQEQGPTRPPNEYRATARPQHQEAAAASRPQQEDRRDSKQQQHQEAILARTQMPAAARPYAIQQPTRAPVEDPLPENRGPAAFYRGSFLRVRQSQEHLNESSRGPVHRRQPISHLRTNTRRGLVLNPDSQSIIPPGTWPRILQNYQGYIFGGPSIRSPNGFSWRRLFGSYLRKRNSKI